MTKHGASVWMKACLSMDPSVRAMWILHTLWFKMENEMTPLVPLEPSHLIEQSLTNYGTCGSIGAFGSLAFSDLKWYMMKGYSNANDTILVPLEPSHPIGSSWLTMVPVFEWKIAYPCIYQCIWILDIQWFEEVNTMTPFVPLGAWRSWQANVWKKKLVIHGSSNAFGSFEIIIPTLNWCLRSFHAVTQSLTTKWWGQHRASKVKQV